MKEQNPILVTKSFLPTMEEYTNFLNIIWESRNLSNNGILLQKLTEDIKKYLNISYLTPTSSGTIALQLSIKALNLKGEIITTPFSYMATSSSIVWEGCKPVFVDIDPDQWTIDVNKIEAHITSQTTAILATHVFGIPCEIEQIERIAKRYNLKVIYDAAHGFGVSYKDKSLLSYGDISICSFHSTKLFHTAEGGCIVTQDENLLKKIVNMHNNGDLNHLGINGKMSELHAAMGLSILPHVDVIIAGRKKVFEHYNALIDQNKVQIIKIPLHTKWNFNYYPVLFKTEKLLLETMKVLNENNIFPRRYFYPSLSKISYFEGKGMNIAESISERILCLPLYHDLELKNVEKIATLINNKLL